MKIGVEISGVDGLAKGLEDDVAVFVTAAIREAGEVLKADWRDQIQAARLGPRLARTIRSQIFPAGQNSIDAAALVSTRAPKIIDSYARGATITARNGRFLAIPTDDVPKKRQGNRLSPEEVEARFGKRLIFIDPRANFSTPSRRNNGVAYLAMRGLVVRRASSRWRNATANQMTQGHRSYRDSTQNWVIMFILVPRVKVSKRLDLDALARAADARFDGLLTKNWRS